MHNTDSSEHNQSSGAKLAIYNSLTLAKIRNSYAWNIKLAENTTTAGTTTHRCQGSKVLKICSKLQQHSFNEKSNQNTLPKSQAHTITLILKHRHCSKMFPQNYRICPKNWQVAKVFYFNNNNKRTESCKKNIP